ncbi:helix-turn-helix transcriptional regulator [Amycolatopsis rhabdoformis]|uniref:Helix-turn-helix transcriptional regulator n=1 Tax=Amycolatopsis rhabdoformis TaxID=1448059 RepID=A0ABZ1I8A6_9PSEU|nr:helix-turn-helix transcriptional regulator [Amycolatopsis rhabdoformis]WSE30659.1 helix-turn-helix transcriptional regulator [Amycolatopsis rhabdoformis]
MTVSVAEKQPEEQVSAPKPLSALEQLVTVAVRLDEVRREEGLTFREAGRMLGLRPENVHGVKTRAATSTTVPLFDAYARLLGCSLRVLLVEDDPGKRLPPWRQRMPHGDNPADEFAMTELWRLQRELHRLRQRAGYSCDDVAAALGINAIWLWRMENTPVFVDHAVTNVMMLARFFGYTVRLHLAGPEVMDVGWWISDDDSVVYDGNPETGDDEPHARDE